MPPLSTAELADLRADIEANGVQIAVVVDDDGRVIDGHHRRQIADELGVPCPRQVVTGYSDAELRSMAYRLNVHRRHLSQEQKREALAASLKADPGLSDRQHAERIGVSNSTASLARRELESTGAVCESHTRTDTAGRQQPASKPSPVDTAYSKAVEEFPDLARYVGRPDRAVALSKQVQNAGRDLSVVRGQFERLAGDDRFARYSRTEAGRSELARTRELLQRLLALLDEAAPKDVER